MIILVEVKTSYAKIGLEYEVVSVSTTEAPLADGCGIPQDMWINEYLEVEYYIKEE